MHTCSLDFRRNAHRHATSSVIVEHILGKLDTPYRSYDPTAIARDMEPFGASIRGYMQYLRPIYPLTWGIVVAEINKSWKWFMSNLKELIGDSDNLVFVSNGKKSIDKAITQLFPLSHHGCCIWHLEKNLIQRYSNASAILLFKRAATTYRVEDFERLMGQILRVSARAHGYLERADYSFWSRALFIGHRYNIMSNNNVESLNSMLKEAGSLSITCLVEHIWSTMQKWFYERKKNAIECSTVLTPRMENELRMTFESGTRLRAHLLTNNLTQVGISNNVDIVDFFEDTCTCREFQLNRMSCVHATRAAYFREKSMYDLFAPLITHLNIRGVSIAKLYILLDMKWTELFRV
ncbi:uncharacterized protein LOC111400597 [Olea europaea var. sylvestris]|uniref:uncharacterized protein LOC111400597 n=1 Tax=Olea europaea var. sylvestris TaxID=158386 RepID=UPI000C1D0CA5|nr:uncharacterized protein LOC111400597 [Olea europaea var. sylvestris]